MIEQVHIQPQLMSDILNRGFKLGGSMFKKVSPFFYIITILYFLANYYIAELLGLGQLGEIFLTLANLSYSFFVTAYFMRILMRESDPLKHFGKWTFIKVIPVLAMASLFYWVFFLLGSILFIVPGIIFFLYFVLFPTIIVFEQKSLVESFKRSAQLVRGSFLRVALIYAVFLGLQAVAIMIVSLFLVNDWFWLTAIVAAFIHILILPFQAAVLNLLYFELRAEREAFDFEVFQYEAQKQLTALINQEAQHVREN